MEPQLIRKLDLLIDLMSKNQALHETSSAAQIILSVVPLIAIIFGASLLFFFFLWSYRLKRELIKSGQYTHTTVKNLRVLTLLLGILCTAIGLPMSILFFWIEGVQYIVLGGLIPTFAGLGLLLFYIFSRKSENLTINKTEK